jgi:hypothetical protein
METRRRKRPHLTAEGTTIATEFMDSNHRDPKGR